MSRKYLTKDQVQRMTISDAEALEATNAPLA